MQSFLFAACYSAAVDMRLNTISLFHVIEEMSSPAFPFAIPNFTLAGILGRTADEANTQEGAEVVFIYEGQELLRHPTPVNFQGRLRLRLIVEVGGLSLAGPGTLMVSLRHNETQIASWPIIVRSIVQPTAQVELGI